MSIHFTGTIPKNYDAYLGPLMFEEYAIEVCSRVGSSVQLALEVGCGTGRLTKHLLARLHPSSRLIASDISPEMMAVAQEKLKDQRLEWQVEDAQQLSLANESCDLVVCCFGYMFVPDKTRAFTEAFRVLRPGGTLLLTTWDKMEYNGASNIFRSTVKEKLGDSLSPTYKLPFSMSDPDEIRDYLQRAWFSQIAIDSVEKVSVSESAQTAAYGLLHGGSIYTEIARQGAELIDEIMIEVETKLAAQYGSSPMKAPMRAWVIEAKK